MKNYWLLNLPLLPLNSMRISLLLEREPFGAILVKTLERFLPVVTGREHRVQWCVDPSTCETVGGQTWLCNIHLNAIFAAGAGAHTLEPVVREFSRSRVWWRRPAQQAYVALAAARRTAPWLAQSTLQITPSVPRAEELLIVGGNHKLRLLDRQANRAYAMLKDGFDCRFIEREIQTRRLASALALPTPRLEQTADDGSWFAEEYVSGTPLNRLKLATQAQAALVEAQAALARLYEATAEETTVGVYVETLSAAIERHLLDNPLLAPRRPKLEVLRERLVKSLEPFFRQTLVTAITHGDFQPANILCDEDRVWLIDWEYSARRQLGYDALVYALRSRAAKGLTLRLHEFFHGQSVETAWLQERCPEVQWDDREQRRQSGTLFLLEELLLQLEENANQSFIRTGHGLTTLQREIGHWFVAANATR